MAGSFESRFDHFRRSGAFVDWRVVEARAEDHFASLFTEALPDLDVVSIRGTWRLEDELSAWPNQTTTLQCTKVPAECLEATAIFTDNSLMPVSIQTLKVLSWTSDHVVIQGPESICVSELYTVDLRVNSVSGLATRKAGCNVEGKNPKRMRMIGDRESR